MSPLLAPQILLGLTLLVSGVAKLRDRTATRDAMRSLRVPVARAHGVVASLLPVAEIVLALALWVPVRAVQGVAATAVLALMLAYLVVIARALGFGEPVVCSCFGTLASPTVSRATLARNALLSSLAVIALGVAVSGRAAEELRAAPLEALGWTVALALAVVLTGFALGGITGGAASPHGPAASPSGATAPGDPPAAGAEHGTGPGVPDATADDELEYQRRITPFGILREEDGGIATLRELTATGALLLVWLNPGCAPCERVMERMPAWREAFGHHIDVRSLVPPGARRPDAATRERMGAIAEDIEANLAISLRGGVFPSAVLVGADGMLAGGPVSGAGDVIGFGDEIAEQIEEARREGRLPAAGRPADRSEDQAPAAADPPPE